jgi:ribosomal protein L31E
MIKFETVQEFLARGGKIQKVPSKKRASKQVRSLSKEDVKHTPTELTIKLQLK